MLLSSPAISPHAEVISFPGGQITLQGILCEPVGKGRLPAVVYNHGSATGMLSKKEFEVLGPVFASHGWISFGPFRRGNDGTATGNRSPERSVGRTGTAANAELR